MERTITVTVHYNLDKPELKDKAIEVLSKL